MNLNDIGLIVSLVMALCACVGVLWGFAYRWGGLSERISNIEEKLNLLYTVYVENALVTQYQSGNVSHSSPYRLTIQGQKALMGIADLLTQSE